MRRLLLVVLVAAAAVPAGRGAQPLLSDVSVSNGSTPFAGDGPLLTTISPNGDGFRDAAVVSFTLERPARVTLEIDRTTSRPVPVATQQADLAAGPHSLTWAPAPRTRPRTFLVRLTAAAADGTTQTIGSSRADDVTRTHPPVIRLQEVDAGFTAESYAPGERGVLWVSTDAPSLRMQFFRSGGQSWQNYSDSLMAGVPVTQPTTLDWRSKRDAPHAVVVHMGAWPSGVYYAQLSAPDGRIGFAPFVVRPATPGAAARVLVVVPTMTWQAYNFEDADGDGWGDTWYAGTGRSVQLGRPFLRRGAPPFFYRYDQELLRWLAQTGRQADYLADVDLDGMTGDQLAAAYDLVVFEGHTEYVTSAVYDAVQRYRDLGGNLAFLSANSFFWRVERTGETIRRTATWRALGRPEAALLGAQYRANDEGTKRGPFVVRSAATLPWLWAGTGLADGSTFGLPGGYGIEIDATTAASPPGTVVAAEIPDVFGAGLTAQMTYYETPAGAKVFDAGVLGWGGSATTSPMREVLGNLWSRLAAP